MCTIKFDKFKISPTSYILLLAGLHQLKFYQLPELGETLASKLPNRNFPNEVLAITFYQNTLMG